MNEYIVIIISSIISILVSIIVANYTTKISFKSNLKVRIIEKRELLYLGFYEHLCKMLTDQTLVLQKEYLQKMESFIAQLKLFLSSKVYDETTKVVSWIYQIKQEYEKQYKINNPQFDTNFLEEVYDYNTGEVDKAIFVPNWAWDEFSKNICQLKCDLTPELKVVKSKLYPLCEAMRKDIGSNLK